MTAQDAGRPRRVPANGQTDESAGYGVGLSVTEGGVVMLPSATMMLIAGPLGGRLGARFGFRFALALGTVLAAASFALQAVAHSEVWHVVAGGALVGFGISFAFASMADLIVSAVDPREVGIATGIDTITRTVGGAFGAALVTALLTAEVVASSALPSEGAYTDAFAASAVGCVLALGATLMVPRPGHARAEARVPAAEAAHQAA